MASVAATYCFLLTATAFSQQKPPNYRLPAGARVIEEQSLEASGHPNRALLLWMVKPEKNAFSDDPDELYMCPDETRGSCYSGRTRVSLIDATNRVINTVKITDVHLDNKDTFDIPYAIRENDYYHVEGELHGNGERNVRVMFLKDYNGDGRALEFALFDAPFCMGLATTLIGYSEAQDKVIQYSIKLQVIEGDERFTDVSRWADYLFSKAPVTPGYWKYEIDYRGRGGPLDQYEIRYNAKAERFEGKLIRQTEQ